MTKKELESLIDKALFKFFSSKTITLENGAAKITDELISSGIVTVEPEPVREFWLYNHYKNSELPHYVSNDDPRKTMPAWNVIRAHDVTQCHQWHEKWKKLKEWSKDLELRFLASTFRDADNLITKKMNEIENE